MCQNISTNLSYVYCTVVVIHALICPFPYPDMGSWNTLIHSFIQTDQGHRNELPIFSTPKSLGIHQNIHFCTKFSEFVFSFIYHNLAKHNLT